MDDTALKETNLQYNLINGMSFCKDKPICDWKTNLFVTKTNLFVTKTNLFVTKTKLFETVRDRRKRHLTRKSYKLAKRTKKDHLCIFLLKV